jgi:polysaccharide export outer membrane protein
MVDNGRVAMSASAGRLKVMKKDQAFAIPVLAVVLAIACGGPAGAQTTTQGQAKPPDPQTQARPADPKAQPATPDPKSASPAKPGMKTVPPVVPASVAPPPADYVIGPDDVLQVLFWKEPQNSAEVIVRPDGLISLPMINDIKASGLTPEQLRQQVIGEAKKFIIEPDVSVIIKAINSRKVFITGQVARPGAYPLGVPTTVLELIATAGGLGEWANEKKITIMRTENGKPVSLKFNYKDVVAGKNLKQNILLKPGDMVIVP